MVALHCTPAVARSRGRAVAGGRARPSILGLIPSILPRISSILAVIPSILPLIPRIPEHSGSASWFP